MAKVKSLAELKAMREKLQSNLDLRERVMIRNHWSRSKSLWLHAVLHPVQSKLWST